MENFITIGTYLVLICLGFFVGTWNERRHYASIRKREEELRRLLVIPTKIPPQFNHPYQTELVTGSVVIAMDYFKMVYAGLINLVGGRMKPLETLVERARREAILRMKEDAQAKNGQLIFNVKFSTTNLLGQDKQKKGGCVEVIAYGTAIIMPAD